MSNQILTILGLSVSFFALIIGAWLRYLFGRVASAQDTSLQEMTKKFESINRRIDAVMQTCKELDASDRESTKSLIELQTAQKIVEALQTKISDLSELKSEFLEKFARRADVIREMQAINSQLEAVYRKIDKLDERRLR